MVRGQRLRWQKDPAKGLPHTFPSTTEHGHHPRVCGEAPNTKPWGPQRSQFLLAGGESNPSKPFHLAQDLGWCHLPPEPPARLWVHPRLGGHGRCEGKPPSCPRQLPRMPPVCLRLCPPPSCPRNMPGSEDAQPYGGGCSVPCHGISLDPSRESSKRRSQGECRANMHTWASGVTSPLPQQVGSF